MTITTTLQSTAARLVSTARHSLAHFGSRSRSSAETRRSVPLHLIAPSPRSSRLVLFAAVALLPLLLVGCSLGTVEQSSGVAGLASDGSNVLAVSGRGEVTAEPDIALVTLGVSVLRSSVTDALGDAAESMQAVLDTLDDAGVDEEDITTTHFSIDQEFDRLRSGVRRSLGYRVDNDVRVKIRDVADVGEIIDAVVAAAGDDVVVNRISFRVDDPREMLAEARELAMADARAKAEQLASLADVKLGKVMLLNESSNAAWPDRRSLTLEFALASSSALVATTPIVAGQLTVTASVSIAYELR